MKDNRELELYLEEKLNCGKVEIVDSVTYTGGELLEAEIDFGEQKILENENYIIHYGQLLDGNLVGLITTDYNDDESLRYQPLKIVKFDSDSNIIE